MQVGTKQRREERQVRKKARALIAETWESQANLSLFLGLLVLTVFFLPSIGFGKEHEALYTDIVFSLLVISGMAIAWGHRIVFAIGAAIGVAALSARWYAYFRPHAGFELWREQLALLTIAMIGAILLIQVFTHGSVTWARVQGAIAVYLMFGFGWAHAYAIAMHFNPHGFTSSVGMLTSVADWTYFSFATLTTLGYGDIVPSGPLSRMLAVSEALTGQLYLTVLIARLVALQVTSAQEGTSRGS